MYSIIENYNNTETIIGNVKSIDDFVAFVKNGLHTETYIFNSDSTIETILNGRTFGYNKYVIHNENVITYFEKVKGVNPGYLYNSDKPELKILYTWRLVKNETFNDTHDNYVENINKKNDTTINSEELDVNTVKTLNVNEIKYNDKISIIGMRNSGKSWIIRNILQNFNEQFIKNSLIISPTEQFTPFYISNFNSQMEYTFNAEIINNFIENKNHGAIILDDCLNSQFFEQNTDLLTKLLNSDKLVIITYQFPFLNLSTFNFDYYFLLKYSFYSNQNKLYKLINTKSLSLQSFKECFAKLTDNYGCMVSCNNEIKLSNKIKYFKIA